MLVGGLGVAAAVTLRLSKCGRAIRSYGAGIRSEGRYRFYH